MHYHGIALTFLLCIVLKCSAQYYYEIRGGPVSDANTMYVYLIFANVCVPRVFYYCMYDMCAVFYVVLYALKTNVSVRMGNIPWHLLLESTLVAM